MLWNTIKFSPLQHMGIFASGIEKLIKMELQNYLLKNDLKYGNQKMCSF